jgi:hypothetical protein
LGSVETRGEVDSSRRDKIVRDNMVVEDQKMIKAEWSTAAFRSPFFVLAITHSFLHQIACGLWHSIRGKQRFRMMYNMSGISERKNIMISWYGSVKTTVSHSFLHEITSGL